MIAIYKKGKEKTEAPSYRSISLTRCLVKALEMIINTRLKWFLESKELLASDQASFQEHHSIKDQTTYLRLKSDSSTKSKHSLYGSIYRKHSIKFGLMAYF